MANETRFGILKHVAPARAADLAKQAQQQVREHYALYQHLAHATPPPVQAPTPPPASNGTVTSPVTPVVAK